jgi:hypothetical protein
MRYFVNAYLDSFYTKTSGDVAGKGEFYFKSNKKRYPDVGEIHLGKNEYFNPPVKPTIYTALVEDKAKEIKFDFEVWEADPGLDDKFLDKEFKLPLKLTNQTFDLVDKKGKVNLKVLITIQDAGKY